MELNCHLSSDSDGAIAAASSQCRTSNKAEFPIKLYAMLQLADNNICEFTQSVSWLPHGRAFVIHDKVKFMKEVVPFFFNQTKIRSFNRQLHMWGFRRIGQGSDQVWYHDNFLRGKPECIKKMIRTKIKGNKSSKDQDVRFLPNLEELPPLPIVCNKLPPPDVLEVMKNVIQSKLPPPICTQPAPSRIVNNISSTHSLPSKFAEPARTASLSLIENTSLPAVSMSFSPKSQSSTIASNDYYAPPPFSRNVSEESPPTSSYHQDQYQDDMMSQQINGTMSPMRRQSDLLQDPFKVQTEPDFSFCSNNDDLNLHCSEQSQNINFNSDIDFEPLSIMNDDEPCDEFASFIEDAIQQIE